MRYEAEKSEDLKFRSSGLDYRGTKLQQSQFFVSLVTILTIGNLSCHDGQLQEKRIARIDTTIIKIHNYTGDGIRDTSFLYITGEDFDSSFSWTYELRSHGETILYRQGSDSGWDRFFAEKGFEADRGDYATCKSKFFYDELGLSILQPKDYNDSGLVVWMTDTTRSVTYPFLRDSCRLDDHDARAIIDSLANAIMNHAATLTTFMESPASNEPVMTYVTRLKRFVPIYKD